MSGPGKWELEAHKASRPTKHHVVTTIKAIPTATHMMFVKLYQDGVLKAVVSQNTDGLHRRSGIPANGKPLLMISSYLGPLVPNQFDHEAEATCLYVSV